MDAVLENLETAPVTSAEKELLKFVRSVNGRSFELRAEELDSLRRAGWPDEAIYDAVTVCALFNFYNRWCDGAGVNAMSAEAHEASGQTAGSVRLRPAPGSVNHRFA